ncbi:hypothetical protein F5880DRAFT_947572 [Lentinula raphanica]|nr:hypothetical protein F5880DRAFT_947572 [Lentinula raphanica]
MMKRISIFLLVQLPNANLMNRPRILRNRIGRTSQNGHQHLSRIRRRRQKFPMSRSERLNLSKVRSPGRQNLPTIRSERLNLSKVRSLGRQSLQKNWSGRQMKNSVSSYGGRPASFHRPFDLIIRRDYVTAMISSVFPPLMFEA